ncbi:MAG: 2Fe-2S iron-sulfur cluster binding domain-containing protein [Ignavibacteria bacterium]|nr:2Fe-2S iron-sulfur cluster binding domain-containing protein [Ignavibacteria bacterium]
MTDFYFIPCGKKVKTVKGKNLLDIALENDVVIDHNCGGVCACVSCRVVVLSGKSALNRITKGEIENLKETGLYNSRTRLACRVKYLKKIKKDIVILIPSDGKN